MKFGRSAAELHLAMDQMEMNLPRNELNLEQLLDKSLQRILQYIGEEHPHAAFLKEYVEMITSRINAKVGQGLDWGLCHGDMHGNNNVHQDGELFSHYDFEWSSYGWRSYDLAQVLISRRRNQSAEQAEISWNAILKGYRSVRAFSALDEQAVEDFVMVCRLWVMSLDVHFIGTLDGALDFGEEWLNAFIQEFRTYASKVDGSVDFYA
jgi:Ser/Thr protein kinase RdoA (MazF antagonist)